MKKKNVARQTYHPHGPGCLFRIGGDPERPKSDWQARHHRRHDRPGRGGFMQLRGTEVRGALRHAVAGGQGALPACHFHKGEHGGILQGLL